MSLIGNRKPTTVLFQMFEELLMELIIITLHRPPKQKDITLQKVCLCISLWHRLPCQVATPSSQYDSYTGSTMSRSHLTIIMNLKSYMK